MHNSFPPLSVLRVSQQTIPNRRSPWQVPYELKNNLALPLQKLKDAKIFENKLNPVI